MSEVALRVGKDFSVSRVELVVTESGGSAEWLRRQIGCRLFDVVRLAPGVDMWVDDEGMPAAGDWSDLVLEFNALSTVIAGEFGRAHQPYFGAVVIAGERNGCTVGLGEDVLERLERKASDAANYVLGERVAGLVNGGVR